MSENQKSIGEDEIDLRELFFVLWNNKLKIILITGLISIGSIFYSLSLPNIYKSQAIISSASSSSGNLSSVVSQYSGLADMAGISLPSQGGSDKFSMGLEVIKSLSFFEKLVEKYDLFFELQAPEGWNPSDNSLIINPEIYDVKENKWISEDRYANNGKPSIQSAHRDFTYNLSIDVDKQTKFVYISYNHFSPYVAKKVLESILFEINEISRAEDITMSEESIKYLQKERASTQLTEVKSGINSIIQNRIETIALAKASREYLVKVLSEPYVPELKSLPDRKSIVILSCIFSFILSSLFFIARHYLGRSSLEV
jgi:uncharacterized protein involved in exopolysaccharide biosynthesis